MPNTGFANLPYPCMGDQFDRQHIEDLAEAADLELNRIKSDIDVIGRNGNAMMTGATAQVINFNTATTVQFTTTAFQNDEGWLLQPSLGNLRPNRIGLYFVEACLKVGTQSVTADNKRLEILLGSTVWASRKYNRDQLPGMNCAISAIIPIFNLGDVITTRFTLLHASGNCTLSYARMSASYLMPCNETPLNANAYFENNTVFPWQGSAGTTVSITTSPVYRGNYSLRAQGPTAGDAVTEEFAVTAGLSYSFQFMARAQTTTVSWRAAIRWYNAAHTFLSQSDGPASNVISTGWRQFFVRATAPAGAVFARGVAIHAGVDATFNVVIDDAMALAPCP